MRNAPPRRIGWLEPPVGLDAAVEPPGSDLAFVNDTGGYLMIQSEIDVEAKGRLDAQTIISWAGLTPGMSVWEAGEAAAEARLLAHPRIRAASVERRFPGQVIVRVEERTPVAVLFADHPLLVARDGVAFPPLAGEETGDLPYVTGLAGEDPTSAPVAWNTAREMCVPASAERMSRVRRPAAGSTPCFSIA